MTQLLHLDASLRWSGSVSRQVGATFADHWRKANPGGTYVYRDLALDPVPHLDEASFTAATTSEDQHTEAQRAGWAISKGLIDDIAAADVVLLGVPMYNFSIPSTLKAWLDRIITPGTAVDRETGAGPLAGKRVVVASSRGGAYGPGTPRENFEFQERYLKAVLSQIGLDQNLTFVNAEMTLADVMPALAQFKDMAAESLQAAHQTVKDLAVRA